MAQAVYGAHTGQQVPGGNTDTIPRWKPGSQFESDLVPLAGPSPAACRCVCYSSRQIKEAECRPRVH